MSRPAEPSRLGFVVFPNRRQRRFGPVDPNLQAVLAAAHMCMVVSRPVNDSSDGKSKIETVPPRVARAALQLDETGVNGSSFHAQTG